MKVVENLQDDFDFNYKTLKSQGGKWILETLKSPIESEFALLEFQDLTCLDAVFRLCGEESLGATVA